MSKKSMNTGYQNIWRMTMINSFDNTILLYFQEKGFLCNNALLMLYTIAGLTDDMRGDASELKERGDQRVVDVSSFLLTSIRVNENQQPVGPWGA